MSEYWKSQDLDGDGLQTINQRYSRLKLKPRTAYLLSLLFPFGAHQFYIHNNKQGLIYLILSVFAGMSFYISPLVFIFFILTEISLLIFDLINLDKRVVQFNKKLRMNLSLQQDSAPPKNFRGKYTDDTPVDDYLAIKENEITAFETKEKKMVKSRIYSFAEQEAMLKKMGRDEKTKP